MSSAGRSPRLALVLSCAALIAATLAPAWAVDEGYVVIANRGSGDISVIDVATDSAVTLPLSGINPPEPMYVVHSPAKGRVFVGDRANNRIVVLRATDFSVEATVAAGNGVFHMWASSAVDQLWVNNDVDNTITVVDTITLEVIQTIPLPADLVALGGKPHDVILAANAPYAYVTMLGFDGPADYVVQYSTTSFAELNRAMVGKDPHLSLNRQTGKLYVPCQNSNSVFVLDRTTLDELEVLIVPGAHGAGMTRNGKIFYTTNLPDGGIDALFTIATKTDTVLDDAADAPVAVPHNIALTPNGKKIYVTHSGSNSVVTVYTATRQDAVPDYLTTVEVGDNPFGLAFVP